MAKTHSIHLGIVEGRAKTAQPNSEILSGAGQVVLPRKVSFLGLTFGGSQLRGGGALHTCRMFPPFKLMEAVSLLPLSSSRRPSRCWGGLDKSRPSIAQPLISIRTTPGPAIFSARRIPLGAEPGIGGAGLHGRGALTRCGVVGRQRVGVFLPHANIRTGQINGRRRKVFGGNIFQSEPRAREILAHMYRRARGN